MRQRSSATPEAWVEGYEPLIEAMSNDAGDRHVLAAAVRSHAELVVTYNRRHFPPESLQAWEIEVQGPSSFLRGLYDLDAGLFTAKLHRQAEAIGAPMERLLRSLAKNVPGFVTWFCGRRDWRRSWSRWRPSQVSGLMRRRAARRRAPATKCGRISAEFLAGERQAMGERMFRQEYLCEFLASRSQLIPRKVVDGAVTAEEKALDLRRVFGEE